MKSGFEYKWNDLMSGYFPTTILIKNIYMFDDSSFYLSNFLISL